MYDSTHGKRQFFVATLELATLQNSGDTKFSLVSA